MLFEKIMPGLLRDGGYDYRAIDYVFKVSGISKNKRQFYFDKCLVVIDSIQEARVAESGKPNQDRIDR